MPFNCALFQGAQLLVFHVKKANVAIRKEKNHTNGGENERILIKVKQIKAYIDRVRLNHQT